MWVPLVLAFSLAGTRLPGLSDAQTHARVERQLPSVKRLSPHAFPSLGTPVRTVLQRLRCAIPQTASTVQPHNVIRGRFLSAQSQQWAVLCSRDGTSTILVVDDGGKVLATLGRGDDVNYMRSDGSGAFVYAREIAVVHPDQIRTAIHRHGDPGQAQTLRLDHDGIDDRFVETAAITFFWSGSEWVEVLGAD